MSPALKAMVDAMAAEFARQDGADRGQANSVDAANLNEALIDGWFDLEKVARAGLEAILEPGVDASNAGGRLRVEGALAPNIYRAMLYAILKEAP